MSRYKHVTNMTIFLVGLTLVEAGWDCKQCTAACNDTLRGTLSFQMAVDPNSVAETMVISC